jgi:hypothetical protein
VCPGRGGTRFAANGTRPAAARLPTMRAARFSPGMERAAWPHGASWPAGTGTRA